MRLWHQSLLKAMPRQQLLGQHRECCALRGKGWGKKHATVDYVFNYSPYKLYQYHCLVITEMQKRGYKPDVAWLNSYYRGKHLPAYLNLPTVPLTSPIYPEHNDTYLHECLDNLKNKQIFIESTSIK